MNKLIVSATTAVLGVCLVARSSPGQTVPAKGTAQTLEVASWNIEWFGSPSNGPSNDPLQLSNVVSVITQADVDLWALQEIASSDRFVELLDALGEDYDGVLAPTSAARGLGLGYIYRTATVSRRSTSEILAEFSDDFAGRPPFKLEANVLIGDSARQMVFINVHMKAFSDVNSWQQRVDGSNRLKLHVDFSDLSNKSVVILGDLNDLLVGSITSGRESPYLNFVGDAAGYVLPTLQLQLDGRNTWCGSSTTCTFGSAIDHIILSNEIAPWYISESVDHYDELLTAIPDYVNNTSDHLPVFTFFDLGTNVGLEDQPDLDHSDLLSAYPNPFSTRLIVDLSTDAYGPLTVDLHDITGRIVASANMDQHGPGPVRVEMVPAGIAKGVYFLSVRSGRGTVAKQTVIHR